MIMKDIVFGRIAGLTWSARPSAFASWLLVWAALTVIGVTVFSWPWPVALGMALCATLIYVFSETAHQIGHAIAAHGAGQPMTGVRFWGPLASSLYPQDEPALPPAIHVRRALGGPIANAILSILAGIWVALAGSDATQVARLAQFTFGLNLLVYTAQSFVPLGFNDGATLARWLPQLLKGKS
jgi:hypothetical protein